MVNNISINSDRIDIDLVMGLRHLLKGIATIPNSNITKHSYVHETISKSPMGSVIYVNEKKVYLDIWEYGCPTFSVETINANFDLIIKLQVSKLSADSYVNHKTFRSLVAECGEVKFREFIGKITPWTFFPNTSFERFAGKEQDLIKNKSEKRLAFFCGKFWKSRHAALNKLKEDNLELIESDRKLLKSIPDVELIEKMLESRVGLVLAGRSGNCMEAKNRREIEYMMMGKPLVLNYKPNYFNNLEAGRDYIYWDTSKKLSDVVSKYDLDFIGKNGHCWYLENASLPGIGKSFEKLMAKKCII